MFQLSTRSSRSAARIPDVDRFDDVLAELLQPLVLFHLALQRAVERGVLDRDAHVAAKRQQQFHVHAREKIAVFGPAHAQEGDRPAADRAGQVIRQIEIGDGAPHGGRPAARYRIQLVAGALEEQVGLRQFPVEEAQIQIVVRSMASVQSRPIAIFSWNWADPSLPSSARKNAMCRIESV